MFTPVFGDGPNKCNILSIKVCIVDTVDLIMKKIYQCRHSKHEVLCSVRNVFSSSSTCLPFYPNTLRDNSFHVLYFSFVLHNFFLNLTHLGFRNLTSVFKMMIDP
jgi:hypothetical protein